VTVRVRLFAALRELAGAAVVEAEGRTAGEVADALGRRFGERFAAIAASGSLVLNGERAGRDTPVADGDELAILPPVSGGAASAQLQSAGRNTMSTRISSVSPVTRSPYRRAFAETSAYSASTGSPAARRSASAVCRRWAGA
jgi:MoaD family protein